MNDEQHQFPGGIYFERSEEGPRADIYLKEGGLGEKDAPRTIDFEIVSGSSVFTLAGVVPADLKNLGKWICGIAIDVQARERRLAQERKDG